MRRNSRATVTLRKARPRARSRARARGRRGGSNRPAWTKMPSYWRLAACKGWATSSLIYIYSDPTARADGDGWCPQAHVLDNGTPGLTGVQYARAVRSGSVEKSSRTDDSLSVNPPAERVRHQSSPAVRWRGAQRRERVAAPRGLRRGL